MALFYCSGWICGLDFLLYRKPLNQSKMEEIVIYRFQLEKILEALRLTSNIHNSTKGETCHDRQVRVAYQYAQNALNWEHKKQVSYITGKSE